MHDHVLPSMVPAPGTISLVSGGSRGLGLVLVNGLLTAKGKVATFSRSKTDAISRLEQNAETADRILFAAIDGRDSQAVGEFVKTAATHFGGIDVLVNNAGVARDGVHALFADDRIDEVIDINLRATLKLTKQVIRVMLAQARGGRIINISSIIGQRGYRGLATYSATKAALDGLTRALARELGDRKILVNSIAPGYLRTEMTHGLDESQMQQIVRRTPLQRLGEPDDIVALLLFLCSDGASFLTGNVITVDGGLTT